jgi:hypothetical protein
VCYIAVLSVDVNLVDDVLVRVDFGQSYFIGKEKYRILFSVSFLNDVLDRLIETDCFCVFSWNLKVKSSIKNYNNR